MKARLAENAEQCRIVAKKTIVEVKQKMGLTPVFSFQKRETTGYCFFHLRSPLAGCSVPLIQGNENTSHLKRRLPSLPVSYRSTG